MTVHVLVQQIVLQNICMVVRTFPTSAGMFMELVANPIPNVMADSQPTNCAIKSSSSLWIFKLPAQQKLHFVEYEEVAAISLVTKPTDDCPQIWRKTQKLWSSLWPVWSTTGFQCTHILVNEDFNNPNWWKKKSLDVTCKKKTVFIWMPTQKLATTWTLNRTLFVTQDPQTFKASHRVRRALKIECLFLCTYRCRVWPLPCHSRNGAAPASTPRRSCPCSPRSPGSYTSPGSTRASFHP